MSGLDDTTAAPPTPPGVPGGAVLAEQVTRVVADAADGPAIVMGSLPPRGRDLDLLVRRSEYQRLAEVLPAAGFVRRGSSFAWFSSFSGYAVELIEAERYLGAEALQDLFNQAIVVADRAPLAQPAPPHALLILARLVAEEGWLGPKRRARLERILAADPRAWDAAFALGPAWRAENDLAGLRREWDSRARHRPPAGPLLGTVARRARRRVAGQRPLLVSLSGIDGSGKSSQTRWLAETLTSMGLDVDVVWNDLNGNFVLDVVGAPVKLLLTAAGQRARPMARYQDDQESAAHDGDSDPGASTPEAERRGPVREAWSAFVTLSNGLEQRAQAARARLRHDVVVFDRGPLDLAVRMVVLYGTRAPLERIVELSTPPPGLSFFLEIPPELSRTRKDDVWSLRQLRAHAQLYDQLAERFGARRLDGTRAPEDLAAEIARTVWQQMP